MWSLPQDPCLAPEGVRSGTCRDVRLTKLSAILIAVASLSACGGGGGGSSAVTPPPPPPPVTYTANSGVAQKGPLIKGSSVTAQELDSRLSPTGKQYSYQISSDLGSFSPTSAFSSQYIGISATGYYFDEVANAVSTGPVTLNGYSDLTAASVLNVNLLTTLAYQRIQHLVTSSNMTFAAATTQAEKEVLAALNIPAGSYGGFSALDLSGSTDGDHILAAMSSVFVYGNSAGPLSQLIANFQSDIGTNGVITNSATQATLTNAGKSVNPAAVAANLTQAYSSTGVTFTAANISDWIDQDGDSVIGKFKFQVADATPSSMFSFPTFVVDQVAGTSVSASGGILSVNQAPVTGAIVVQKGDTVAVSPGAGAFPNGVLDVYLRSAGTDTARVSFISGLLSIAVIPQAPSVPKGLTQQFKATGTFSDTSTSDLTNSVTWTSGTPATATVNANSGLANALAVGSTVVTATSGSVSGNTTLNVSSAILKSIAITPSPATAGVGVTAQLTATGTYSDGTTQNVTTAANWTSDTPSVANVGPTTGLASGVSPGAAIISAAIGSVTGTGPLSVVSNVWLPASPLLNARTYFSATLLQDGRVIAVGGVGNKITAYSSTELYDPVANAWSLGGSLAAARYLHTATLLQNGNVLVAAGYSISGAPPPLVSAELYNPSTNTWVSAGSLATARIEHTATLLPNGKVLVTGGQDGNNNTSSSAEIYDPASNSWSAAASMSTPRYNHTATLLQNGLVLVAGGFNGGTTLTSSELYNPATNTWSPAGTLSAARGSQTATLLNSGKVLLAGGFDNTIPGNNVTLAITDLYNPATNTWSPGGTMTAARLGHTATLLTNGKVLVAAGYQQTNTVSPPLASAETYDPSTNIWSPAASLSLARDYFEATLLNSGAVLITGGQILTQSGGLVSNSVELYYP